MRISDWSSDVCSSDLVLAGSGCRIVYTTPVCQNPLGFETGPERRAEILDVCGRHGAFIIEDDVYGLYARKGRATYKSMAPDREIGRASCGERGCQYV